MKRITVVLNDSLHKKLKLYAVNHDESISRICAHAVKAYLENAQFVLLGDEDPDAPG